MSGHGGGSSGSKSGLNAVKAAKARLNKKGPAESIKRKTGTSSRTATKRTAKGSKNTKDF